MILFENELIYIYILFENELIYILFVCIYLYAKVEQNYTLRSVSVWIYLLSISLFIFIGILILSY
jgi:hypothetical protein